MSTGHMNKLIKLCRVHLCHEERARSEGYNQVAACDMTVLTSLLLAANCPERVGVVRNALKYYIAHPVKANPRRAHRS